MNTTFDLSKLESYKEDNRLEVKSAKGGLPESLWSTYSAMANTYGGLIVLGLKEDKSGHFETSKLTKEDTNNLLEKFWVQINNPNKVSANILNDRDITIENLNDDYVIIINVPMANRNIKPIYLNDDIFKGSYKRNYSGDFRLTKEEAKMMLREQVEEPMDTKIIEDKDLSILNNESIDAYRNRYTALKPDHPWVSLKIDQFLLRLGAAKLIRMALFAQQ